MRRTIMILPVYLLTMATLIGMLTITMKTGLSLAADLATTALVAPPMNRLQFIQPQPRVLQYQRPTDSNGSSEH